MEGWHGGGNGDGGGGGGAQGVLGRARASLATLGWHDPAATQRPSLGARRSLAARHSALSLASERQATPLLAVILWTSMACEFVSGFAGALIRRWDLSLPGVLEALTRRTCGIRACPTPDNARQGALHQAFFSAPTASQTVGVVVGAWLLRARGRRAALMAAIATHIGAFAISAAAHNYAMLLAGSLVSEFCVGALRIAVVVVDVELAPPRWRLALLTAAVTAAFGIGAVSTSCLVLAQASLSASDRVWFWRVIIAFGAWPCLLLLAIVPFVPESPLLLVQQGRTAEALQTLKDLRGPFADTKGEFSGIIHAVAEVEGEDARLQSTTVCARALPLQLRQLLSRRHRPSLILAALLGALAAWCSVSDELSSLVEVEARGAFGNFLQWAFVRVLKFVFATAGGVLPVVFNADRFSRRVVLAASVAVHVAGLVALAAVAAQPYGGAAQPPYPKALAAAAFVASTVIVASFHGAIKPMCLLLPAELSGTGTRGAVVAASYVVSRACRILWGLAVDALDAKGQTHLAAILTAAVAAALAALCWLFVPEGTQCVPLENCRHAWQRHWYWGHHAERWAIDLPQRRSSSRRSTLRHTLSVALAPNKPF